MRMRIQTLANVIRNFSPNDPLLVYDQDAVTNDLETAIRVHHELIDRMHKYQTGNGMSD